MKTQERIKKDRTQFVPHSSSTRVRRTTDAEIKNRYVVDDNEDVETEEDREERRKMDDSRGVKPRG